MSKSVTWPESSYVGVSLAENQTEDRISYDSKTWRIKDLTLNIEYHDCIKVELYWSNSLWSPQIEGPFFKRVIRCKDTKIHFSTGQLTSFWQPPAVLVPSTGLGLLSFLASLWFHYWLWVASSLVWLLSFHFSTRLPVTDSVILTLLGCLFLIQLIYRTFHQ